MVCPWTVPEPVCCRECWNAADPSLKVAAQDFAYTFLNAATGRQFGECVMTVRPCGWNTCNTGIEWLGWSWGGSVWQPYILNGLWYNAACGCAGLCSCIPDCAVRLDGPVNTIIEVRIDGVVVDPSTYFVMDQQWLVRASNSDDCWPECADMNAVPGEGFEVTYTRGRPVPTALLNAASKLACEWVKSCTGDSSCRLSSWVVAMSRQGTDFQFVNPVELITRGLTGLKEVDMLITAYNPNQLHAPLRVFAPELRYPRVITWP